MEAAATDDPNVFRITGDYTGEVDVRAVTHTGGNVRFARPPSLDAASAGGTAGSDGRITSPMPGKIASIAVSSGQTVQMHDLLIVLEAMKMEHRIEAPADGSIGAIHVRQGDIVPADALLLEFD
jgi:3-methylcrotonyl-CoA carboxylase alpha subunit